MAANSLEGGIGKITAAAAQRKALITILIHASTELPVVPVPRQN
jgi:hypothetical protein